MPSSSLQKSQHILTAAGIFSLLLVTLWAFQPGLGGALIFDDLPNLQPWKDIGDIRSLRNVLTFTASGAGFPGRPLSLLSFLVDDQNWAPDIFALKRTNLALHLINTCLILWLCLRLFPLLLPRQSTARQTALALFASALWALHPLQVSNVSYIIQRMNLLSTMLELMGLLLFLYGRERLDRMPVRALISCSLAIGIFMPLAILAKENGLLLCAFALLAEGFCFPSTRHRWWKYWKLLFLWGPLAAFLLYILVTTRGFTTGFESRSYNDWERLLTQGPVLVDYLYKLLLPHLHGSGLYFDNFPVSHSLLDPPQTLFCWLLIAALLGLAWRLRHRQPLFTFGIFFYFCGHLMESTVLPLELYFEHRNYLPQIGLWMSVAALLSLASGPSQRRILTVSMVMLLTLLIAFTRNNASLWGNPELQAAIWYNDNPGSVRTTLAYANLLLQKGNFAVLEQVLQNGQRYHPNNLALVVSQRYVQCYWRDIPTRFDDLPTLALHAEYEVASILMLEQMRDIAAQHRGKNPEAKCQPATDQQIVAIYQALLKSPHYVSGHTRSQLFAFSAEVAVDHRQLNEAMYYYDQAFNAEPSPIYPYRQAFMLKSAGLMKPADSYLDKAQEALTSRQRLIYPDLQHRIALLRSHLASRDGALP